MPLVLAEVMTYGDLQRLQRSTAGTHASNQDVRRRQQRRPRGSGGETFRPCVPRPKRGMSIEGARLFQSWERSATVHPFKSVKQIQLEIAAGALSTPPLTSGRRRIELGAAGKKHPNLYNSRPIQSWTVYAEQAGRAADGASLFKLRVGAFAPQHSLGDGGTQYFCSPQSFTAAQLGQGLKLWLYDAEAMPGGQ